MAEITQRTIQTNGIEMRIAEAGAGPLVLMLHGWPESWYSWRHQLNALADAGFHAVAPDQRGYGGTAKPEAIEQYTILHLTGDVIGLLDALGEETAAVAGHDWGAPVAWHAALFRPDRVRAVVGVSVPYRPRRAAPAPPTTYMPRSEQGVFYQLYFQEPGVAEAEFERDVRATMRRVLYGISGSPPPGEGGIGLVPPTGFLTNAADPAVLPPWLTEADIDFYTREFEGSGFRGGLNWYRNIDRNWELMAPFTDAKVLPPALFIGGDRDPVLSFRGMDQVLSTLPEFVPNLRGSVILPGCGHWIQQERPAEVNAALLDFLRGL
jgi:pimeloyl-ACP methyl ester carboxylesterase